MFPPIKRFSSRSRKTSICCFLFTMIFTGLTLPADTLYPRPDWKDAPNPIASPDAETGGSISIFAGPYPKSFNYYLDSNTFSAELFGAMFETLLSSNPVTLEYEPGLAEKWIISDDKKTFTFYLDPKACWSDGLPVTAEDVRWTYDALMNPKNLTGPQKVSLQYFFPPEIVSPQIIRFRAKTVHWQNLGTAGGMMILPKHIFAKKDFNKVNFSFPVVSGLYRLSTVKEGRYVTLERRKNWWNRKALRYQGVGNFQTLKFRFYEDRENAYDAFKKGAIDLFPVYTAHRWVSQTNGKSFEKNWIIKQKIYNYNPIGFQGFAMNARRPLFADVRVRQAIARLVNRPKMNATIMYNQYFLQRSYYEDLYSAAHPCPNPVIPFDKKKARELLREAGWVANPKSGKLEKDGKIFRFHFLARSASAEKFLVIFKEDLADVGIEMSIDKKDWASWARDMEGFNYDMTWAAWSAGVRKNPEGMWSSKEADRAGGNNITGFKNPLVDKLIDQQKTLFDINKRHEICRKIDAILVRQTPYVLLWNINYVRLLYWNRFGMPDSVLSKYGDERSAYWYWWNDEDSEADLQDAMKNNESLPRHPAEIHFDQAFKK